MRPVLCTVMCCSLEEGRQSRDRDRSSSLVGTRMHASGSITRYNGDSRNGDCNDEDGGDDVDEIKSHHKWLCLLATMMLKWRRRRLRPSLAKIPGW